MPIRTTVDSANRHYCRRLYCRRLTLLNDPSEIECAGLFLEDSKHKGQTHSKEFETLTFCFERKIVSTLRTLAKPASFTHNA